MKQPTFSQPGMVMRFQAAGRRSWQVGLHLAAERMTMGGGGGGQGSCRVLLAFDGS